MGRLGDFEERIAQRLFGEVIDTALGGLGNRSRVAKLRKEGVRSAAADFLFGDIIEAEMRRVRLAVDEDWWAKLDMATRPQDMDWATREQNLADVLEAWSLNPFARRIVNLHTAYVVGRQMTISSERKQVNDWIQRFWHHRKNKMYLEIYNLADELCRAGELFFVMYHNPMDGIPYVRAVPARRIVQIVTDPDDYKRPLKYRELREGDIEGEIGGKWWLSPEHPEAKKDLTKPVMLHYALNVPVGATRSWGGDLDTMLPWVRRYTAWLKDRVRINQARNAWVWDMTAGSPARVEELEKKYRGGIIGGSVFVHMPNEGIEAKNAKIEAGDAQDDGRALRMAMAVGGGVAPNFLGDTHQATRATAREANQPVFQAWAMRQHFVVNMFIDLVKTGMIRSHQMGKFMRWLPKDYDEDKKTDWGWTRNVADLTRDDNLALARAGKTIVDMAAVMLELKLIDRKTAITWAAKFTGEVIDPGDIMRAIDNAPSEEEIAQHHQEAVEVEEMSWIVGR